MAHLQRPRSFTQHSPLREGTIVFLQFSKLFCFVFQYQRRMDRALIHGFGIARRRVFIFYLLSMIVFFLFYSNLILILFFFFLLFSGGLLQARAQTRMISLFGCSSFYTTICSFFERVARFSSGFARFSSGFARFSSGFDPLPLLLVLGANFARFASEFCSFCERILLVLRANFARFPSKTPFTYVTLIFIQIYTLLSPYSNRIYSLQHS